MKNQARPLEILEILKSVGAEYPEEMRIVLEVYISDLESRQPQRPPEISTILQTIMTDHPVGMGATLEAYLLNLEAQQQPLISSNRTKKQTSTSRYWHSAERQQQHRERALKKQHENSR